MGDISVKVKTNEDVWTKWNNVIIVHFVAYVNKVISKYRWIIDFYALILTPYKHKLIVNISNIYLLLTKVLIIVFIWKTEIEENYSVFINTWYFF